MIRKIVAACIFLCYGCLTAVCLPFNHPRLYYEGRISQKKDASELSWSGTSVTVLFKGTNLSVILKDAGTDNYYNIIIDNINK